MSEGTGGANQTKGTLGGASKARSCSLVLTGVLTLIAQAGLASLVRADGFSETDFRQIGEQGFGDPGNSYAWTMAEFKGRVFFGSNRHFLCLTRSLLGKPLEGENDEIPIECESDLLDMDFRGRIFAYDPVTKKVELVYVSPTVKALLSDGTQADVPRDAGYRTMVVFQEKDGSESLYVGTFTSRELPEQPARLLRSTDGVTFTEVPGPISNTLAWTAYRAMAIYKNRLYVPVIGKDDSDSVLLESDDPGSGDFRVVHTPGFGDPTNEAPYQLAVFKGYLYVGTANATKGYQLLKTQAEGTPPYTFQPVLVDGAFRGVENENVVSLGAYKDYLYVGSGILFGGYDVLRDVGPAPAEVVRVKGDDSWEIVCGIPRDTPAGHKEPITGLGPGFGNQFTGYIWRMLVHDDVLYVGTFDNAYVLQYGEDVKLTVDDIISQVDRANLQNIQITATTTPEELLDIISAVEGGCDLWSTTNGVQWTRVTRTGFGDQFNYGVRSLLSTSYGMYLGTANPFFGFTIYLGQPPGYDGDGDGFPDVSDTCPHTWNLNQQDEDADGLGNACDDDRDNDCIADDVDPEPSAAAASPVDTDADGIADPCDSDDDNDEVPDHLDNCPLAANYDQVDGDSDGTGDACRRVNPPPDDDGVPPDDEEEPPAEVPPPGVGGSLCGAGLTPGLGFMSLLLWSTFRRRRSRWN